MEPTKQSLGQSTILMTIRDHILARGRLRVRLQFHDIDGVRYPLDSVFRSLFNYNGGHATCMVVNEIDAPINAGDAITARIAFPSPEFVHPDLRLGQKVGLYLGAGGTIDDQAEGEIIGILSFEDLINHDR